MIGTGEHLRPVAPKQIVPLLIGTTPTKRGMNATDMPVCSIQ
jgi:hypothetical protein